MKNLSYTFNNQDYNNYVFIGSSRVLRQIKPILIDSITKQSSYNLGIDQIGIIESKMLLKSYLAHHPKPKTVFLNIDLSTFMFNTDSSGPYNIDEYFSFLSDTLIYNELSRFNFRYRYKNSIGIWYQTKPFWKLFTLSDPDKKTLFLKKALNLELDTQKYSSPNKGFIASNKNWDNAANIELAEINAQQLEDVPTTKEGFELLREFTDVCAKNDIKCVFVFVPWLKKVNKNPNHDQILSQVKAIANNKKVLFLDYSKISMADSTKYFYDIWHFNDLGANKYSKLLADDILRLKL
jgi:hypothetical protein